MFPNPHHEFQAEVLFANTFVVPSAAIEMLKTHGLRYEVIPTEDPNEQTAFGMISGWTALDEKDVGAWIYGVIAPYGGDVVEWGFGLRELMNSHPARC
jgi:hypothetical protein